MNPTLIYIHDPMCSWCWGFTKVYHQILEQLPQEIATMRLLGGLAPDTDEVMPETTRQMIKDNWQRIHQVIPGVEFNYDFWTRCEPRRATYPACRAVIAARNQGNDFDLIMTAKIQRAYYLEAKNPSENSTLIELADEVGLDTEGFSRDLISAETHQFLNQEINQTRSMGINGFPSLVIKSDERYQQILTNYNDAAPMLEQILASR